LPLQYLSQRPRSGLKIIPCGLNYTTAHEFRSSAVVEFGKAVDISRDLVNAYRNGARKEATQQLLGRIHDAMLSVTITSSTEENINVGLIPGQNLLKRPAKSHLVCSYCCRNLL
jgi:hypothetical protein